ncbi:MAG: glutamate--cysteine ligase [Pseudonocardiales bacterium]
MGVEEEFHLLDAESGQLRPRAAEVLSATTGRLAEETEPEILPTQVEIGSPVCTHLTDLHAHLARQRRDLTAAAATAGCRIVATGTWPAKTPPVLPTPQQRYQELVDAVGPTARRPACGCHVHVSVADPDLRVAVIRRVRPWLPVLLAISANSPYLDGSDTGYHSYRSQVWARWPTAGSPPALRSMAEYDEVVSALLATGVLRDKGMLYWDARASQRYDTVEFRVTDVCLRLTDAVLIAGLARGLTRTAVAQERAGQRCDDLRPELLKAAHWQAARNGLGGRLVDPLTGRPAPAAEVVSQFYEHVRPALEVDGDVDLIATGLAELARRGTGAAAQRRAFARAGRISDVIAMLADETAEPGAGS